MLPLAAISAGASLVGAGVSGVQALRQAKQAKKIQVGQRSVSPESEAALAQLKSGATAGFAGKDVARQQQDATIANVLKGDKSPSALAAAMKQSSENALNLAIEEDKARKANERTYIEGLKEMGAEKRDIQEANIQDAITTKTGLQQASSQNLQGMFQGVAGAGESLALSQLNSGQTPATSTGTGTKKYAGAGAIDPASQLMMKNFLMANKNK